MLGRRSLGGYGAVYRALPAAEPEGTPVALKMALHPNDPRFLREAELLRRNRHPHIPRLHEHGLWAHPAGPFPFIVMDWAEGVPLYEWARAHTVTSRAVMQVLAPVAGALAATHAVGGVHRDVKGDNILVRPEDGWPTLLDFGAGDFLGAPTLTRELLPPGTPYYRSPEALRFHWLHRQLPGAHYEPGPADDVYALGVTAYCLVTGSYPAPVLPPELLASDRSFQPPAWEPPEQLVTVCPELAALIHQMLSLQPSARGSAAAVEQALAQVAHTAGPQAEQLILALAQPSGQGGNSPHAEAAEPVARSAIAPAAHPMTQHRSEETAAQRSRTGLPGAACALGAGLAVVALITMVCAREQGASMLQTEESPESSVAQRQQGSRDEDTAPSGLGREALTVRVDTEEPKPSREEISLEMEKEPLPGQARPPCKRREVEINGGCWWKRSTAPPCDEREFEWQGRCYAPVLAPTPPATSKQP